jgi:GTP 3',8-cyclase
LIGEGWQARRDRGAESRKALEQVGLRNGKLIGIDQLRGDPHLEMHARGG